MAKGIDKKAVVPVEGALLAIAILLTSLRLFLRLGLQRTRLTTSDWLLVVSILNCIALFTTDTMAYKLGGMDDYDDPNGGPQGDAEALSLMKVTFSGNYFYDTGIYLPKFALLAFYYRLIPSTMPKLRKVLYVVTGVTCCFAVATCFVDTFWCGKNVSVNWDLNGDCSSFDSMEIVRIDWAMNIVSDLMIFSIPFPLLKGLQVKKRFMVGLVATFSSGMITVAASVSRFATIQAIHAWTNVYVLSMAEMVAAITVVCLPALKALVDQGVKATASRRGTGGGSSGKHGYDKYATSSSHIKLSSGRDAYATTTRVASTGNEDSGSEVELTSVKRPDVIYKSERVSVTYEQRG
ncbi:archaeal flagellin n-terminal-like domain-containing protein [Sarocladium implicatum]|nr:archaeal flagellin n-terminal-like domain-containing protein [Sarocladium implicatum]